MHACAPRGMGKGTYRVTQSNLRFFTFLVHLGMISALEGGLFIGHKNICGIHFSQINTCMDARSIFPCLLKICETSNVFFSKQYLDTRNPFSHASSHMISWEEKRIQECNNKEEKRVLNALYAPYKIYFWKVMRQEFK